NDGKVPMDDLRAWLAADGAVRLEEVEPSENQYAQYVLPGGENYREVVLAMPVGDEARWLEANKAYRDSIRRDAPEEEQDALKAEVDRFETRNEYTSNHFTDVPNYVAHMRTNERPDADGRPGLFIEEIQS